jgi:hypothetical protein
MVCGSVGEDQRNSAAPAMEADTSNVAATVKAVPKRIARHEDLVMTSPLKVVVFDMKTQPKSFWGKRNTGPASGPGSRFNSA